MKRKIKESKKATKRTPLLTTGEEVRDLIRWVVRGMELFKRKHSHYNYSGIASKALRIIKQREVKRAKEHQSPRTPRPKVSKVLAQEAPKSVSGGLEVHETANKTVQARKAKQTPEFKKLLQRLKGTPDPQSEGVSELTETDEGKQGTQSL